MLTKSIQFFGTSATASTHILVESPTSIATGNLTYAKSGFSKMNVILAVPTFTGTQGTMFASIQERFSDLGFVETARTPIISVAGTFLLMHDPSSGSTYANNEQGGFAMLGNGTDKQVAFTVASMTALTANVYFVFYAD